MKKNTIIAAIAAASALLLCASCQKQELVEQNNGINASGKTFTATIEQSLTKTTITSEYKVNWVEGDQIDINGSIFSATPDASDATKATFTKVSGSDPAPDYTAVYPASIMVETQATLPATQTYAAGKFNVPMCAMSSTETLEFKNFCGVLCFALKGTDKVKSIAVTANEQLCGPFEFSTDATFGCFSGGNEGYTVTLDCGEGVQLDASTATNFYVYLPPTDSYTAGMKIVVTSTEGKTFEKTTTTAVKIERNNLYTFDWTASFSPAEPEYVEIGGLKWATMNLGAENVTDYGDYFAWGETAPYYEGTGGWPEIPTWKTGKGSGYAWQSYCGSSSFSEWSTPPYDATTKILKPEFDAAAQTLGNGWRMPTSAEFKALYDACLNGSYDTTTNPSGASAPVGKGVYWCTNYDGVAGCLFCDGTNKLFFPAAGYGVNTSLYFAGSFGYYWSGSLYTDNPDYAYYSYFSSGSVSPQYGTRSYGFSVRPVTSGAAPAPAPLPAGALKGEFSVSADKKVHFSQGNLVATIDANGAPKAWKFATNQYDHLGTGGANKTIGKSEGDIDLFGWSTASTTYGISTSNSSSSYSGDFVDWGKNMGDGNTWRTLSEDEWTYLFNARTASTVSGTATARYAKATVNSKAGVILLPDTYAHPEGVTALTNINTAEAAFTANEYDSTNWEKMESAGAVFLPAAGRRNVSNVSNVGNEGDYWSSTENGTSGAYRLYFKSDNVSFANGNRTTGYGVRLITEVK